MTSDAILVLFLKLLLLLLGICCVGKAQMETNNGTETPVSLSDFSTFTTRTPDQFLSSSVSPGASTTDVSTTKVDQTEFSTTQKVSSNSAAFELSSTLASLRSNTVGLSNTQLHPSSATTKLSDAEVPTSSTTTAELSSTQVASSSQVPGLLQTTADLSPTTSELPTTQVTSNATAAQTTTTASSLDAEGSTPSENASAVPLESDNVTDNALKTDKITEADQSPMTTHSNEHYDVETTAFTSIDNATVSFLNDTNNDTSSDDSDTHGNKMTSLITQPSDDVTTMQSSTNMDASQPTQFSSSISSFLSSSTTTSSSSSSSSQSSLTSPDRDVPPQPQSQPQEMTFAAKVALVFGVMVGVSCVIVVAIVSIRQLLGYWARRDYSNLSQDTMMPFS